MHVPLFCLGGCIVCRCSSHACFIYLQLFFSSRKPFENTSVGIIYLLAEYLDPDVAQPWVVPNVLVLSIRHHPSDLQQVFAALAGVANPGR